MEFFRRMTKLQGNCSYATFRQLLFCQNLKNALPHRRSAAASHAPSGCRACMRHHCVWSSTSVEIYEISDCIDELLRSKLSGIALVLRLKLKQTALWLQLDSRVFTNLCKCCASKCKTQLRFDEILALSRRFRFRARIILRNMLQL